MKKDLAIDLLITDADTQSRITINSETVEDYAELIRDSDDWPFPHVDVFHDGSRYMVADGFHRVLGANRTKRASVPCVIHKGTATDAKIFAMTANDRHGLRMTRADKRSCVEWLIDNCKMTQTEMAVAAGVSRRTVQMIVADLKPKKAQIAPNPPADGGEEDDRSQKAQIAPNPPADGDDSDMEWHGDPRRCQSCGNNHWIDGKCSNGCDDEQEWEEVEDEEDESPEEQARKVRSVCHQHRDKMVRAIDDYHRQKPNRSERDRLVKLIQGVELW